MKPGTALLFLLTSFLLGGFVIGVTLVRFFPDPPVYIALGAGVIGFCLMVAAIVSTVRRLP